MRTFVRKTVVSMAASACMIIGAAYPALALPDAAAATSANAQNHTLASAPNFADVPWGSVDTDVKSALVAKGFKFDKQDADGDLWFQGVVEGTRSEVFEYFDAQRHLVKTTAEILTSDDACKQTYDAVVGTLIAKYSAPSRQDASFNPANTPNDTPQDFQKAVKSDKALFYAAWDVNGGHGGIFVSIQDNLTIRVDYESTAWDAEMLRRKLKPDANL